MVFDDGEVIIKRIRKHIFSAATVLLLTAGAALAADPPAENEAEIIKNTPIAKGVTGSYLSGQFARSSGDIDSAIRYLRKAYKRQPGNIGIANQLEGMLLLDGRMDDAVKVARAMLEQGHKEPVSVLLVALHDVKQGNLEEARATLTHVAESENGQLWLPLVSAWLDVGQQALGKPFTLETLGAQTGQATPIVHYHMGLINAQAGFTGEAATDFLNAVENAKARPARIMEAMLHFYERHHTPSLAAVAEEYRKGRAARPLMEDTPIVESPEDGISEVLFTMGSVMLGAGITQDAVIYLQMALYLQPDLAPVALSLGDAYSELQQYARANEAYGMVPPGSRAHNRAMLRMALNYDQMGKLDAALGHLDEMARQPSALPDAMVVKGDLLRMHQRFDDAIAIYTQAIKNIPELKSDHWPILFARGASFEQQGKWAEAERDLQHALSLKPDQPDVLNYLGFSWLTRGERLEEARLMIEKAIKARPNDAQIVDSMGWALYTIGQYDEAANYLEKAVELLPGDPTINDHLGDAYWRLGRKTEAKFQWERSLTFSPEPRMAENIRKKLTNGLPPLPVSASNEIPLTRVMTPHDALAKAATATE